MADELTRCKGRLEVLGWHFPLNAPAVPRVHGDEQQWYGAGQPPGAQAIHDGLWPQVRAVQVDDGGDHIVALALGWRATPIQHAIAGTFQRQPEYQPQPALGTDQGYWQSPAVGSIVTHCRLPPYVSRPQRNPGPMAHAVRWAHQMLQSCRTNRGLAAAPDG